MRIAFKVETQPEGYDRDAARHGYTTRAVSQWRSDVAMSFEEAARRQGLYGDPYQGPVKLSLEVAGSKADVDNLAKEVMDALKGKAYRDDAQVVALLVSVPHRRLGKNGGPCAPKEPPGAVVVIEFLPAVAG